MPRARRDLARLFAHIARTNPLAAAVLVEEIAGKMRWIAEVNFTGVPRPELGPGMRALPFRNRCIYYLSEQDRIVVLRILHGAQNVAVQRFDAD